MAGRHDGKYGKNQGEGNRDAANRYNDAAARHTREHDVRREGPSVPPDQPPGRRWWRRRR